MNISKQNIPQQKLDDLIARYGEALYHDPHRCEALMRDLCAPEAYPKEIALIRQAQELGLVQDLLQVKHHQADYKTLEAKWLETLKEDYALAEDAAHWMIETWASALKVDCRPTSGAKSGGQQQIRPIVGVAVVLLACFGMWCAEIYRREMEQQAAQQAELQRREEQRKAMIDAAYSKLVCANLPIDQSLEKQKPDFIYPNGTRYYGPLQSGLPMLEKTSQSFPLTYARTMIYNNGSRYDGEFDNSKRSGCGIYAFSDGSIYVGQFANDRFNGIGLFTMVNQSRYIGRVKDGRCHGEGLLILSDGRLYEGAWENSRLKGDSVQCGLPAPQF